MIQLVLEIIGALFVELISSMSLFMFPWPLQKWAASHKKVPKVLSHCHPKRRIGACACTLPSFDMTMTVLNLTMLTNRHTDTLTHRRDWFHTLDCWCRRKRRILLLLCPFFCYFDKRSFSVTRPNCFPIHLKSAPQILIDMIKMNFDHCSSLVGSFVHI